MLANYEDQEVDWLYDGLFPYVCDHYWCGEHHLFPAYLDSLEEDAEDRRDAAAALGDAAEHGTVAWEDMKGEMGL